MDGIKFLSMPAVIIKGGMVQEVFSPTPLKIRVIDLDVDGVDEGDLTEVVIHGEKKKAVVKVWEAV